MRLAWTEDAWDDYLYWQATDKKIAAKINDLIKAIMRDPFKGIGKPEPLKEDLSGYWSRHITGEHRLVYRVSGKDANRQVEVAQCRFHY